MVVEQVVLFLLGMEPKEQEVILLQIMVVKILLQDLVEEALAMEMVVLTKTVLMPLVLILHQ